MFTTRLFFGWQKMLLKMKVLYCPKLPQHPKFPHLTVRHFISPNAWLPIQKHACSGWQQRNHQTSVLLRGGRGCEVFCGGHHHLFRGKTTTASALDGAVFDSAQILAHLVHNMSRSQIYLWFGHFGWLTFSVNRILAGLWLNFTPLFKLLYIAVCDSVSV